MILYSNSAGLCSVKLVLTSLVEWSNWSYRERERVGMKIKQHFEIRKIGEIGFRSYLTFESYFLPFYWHTHTHSLSLSLSLFISLLSRCKLSQAYKGIFSPAVSISLDQKVEREREREREKVLQPFTFWLPFFRCVTKDLAVGLTFKFFQGT